MKYTEKDEHESLCKDHSPGKVSNSEILVRILYNPEHVYEGQIIETAISLEDLKDRGFSVNRKNYLTQQALKEMVQKQVMRSPEKREIKLASNLQCNELRSSINEDTELREFLVVDEINRAEVPVNRAHAAIYSAHRTGRGELRKLRAKLVLIIGKDVIAIEIILKQLIDQ